jgi:hypothetical protein
MKSWPLLLALLIACGPINPDAPANPTDPTGGGGGTPARPPAAGDVSIELDKIPINGVVFEPRALDANRPGMPLVDPKRKVTLAQQRSIVKNARDPVLKQAQAAVLATMLYRESKIAVKDKEKELLSEARQALRDAAASAGKEVDEVTLRMLGSYELLFDDFAAAEVAWRELIEKEPKDEETPVRKAWWAYSLMKQRKDADVLAIVSAEPLSDQQPELAYVTAWAKWGAGDGAAAWEAILTAMKGWGQNAGRDIVERDILLFAGRTKVPFATAMPKVLELLNAKQPAQQFNVLAKLGNESYLYAGRWTDGIAAIEEALKVPGAQISANDRAYLRYTQADFTVRLDTPDVAAKYAKQAIEALGCNPATNCHVKDKQEIVSAVAVMARLFHIMYATANDIRYYQPANDLYVLTIPLLADPQRRTDVSNDANTLQTTLKNTKVGTGTHGKDAIGVLVGRHAQEVQACYEERLVANPKIAGTLIVHLESDQTGAIKGVDTEPKAGQADLAAVASCAAQHARTWNLPKRGMAGTTRVKATFTLAPAPK